MAHEMSIEARLSSLEAAFTRMLKIMQEIAEAGREQCKIYVQVLEEHQRFIKVMIPLVEALKVKRA